MANHKSWISKKNIVYFVYAISVFLLGGYCFFRWETYNVKIISNLAYILYYAGAILMVCYVLSHCKKIRYSSFFIMPYAFLLTMYVAFAGTKYRALTYGDIELLLIIFVICQMSEKNEAQLFEYVAKIFAILVLPSLIYFILSNLGINIPYDIQMPEHTLKSAYGIYYKHYPFGLVMIQNGWISRYCGIFDEAGFVGTLCGFFIAACHNRMDKKWVILLLIEGIFSLSLAFYLLLVIYAIVYAWSKGFVRVAGTILALALGLLLFVNIDFHNESIAHIQSRIDLTSTILVEDNRSNDTTDAEIKGFLNEGNIDVLIGKGRGASSKNANISGWSYKFLLYDYGIIGIVLYIGFFIFYAWKRGRFNKSTFPFIAVFIASIYQRPYVFSKLNITIFMLGISYITYSRYRISFHKNVSD